MPGPFPRAAAQLDSVGARPGPAPRGNQSPPRPRGVPAPGVVLTPGADAGAPDAGSAPAARRPPSPRALSLPLVRTMGTARMTPLALRGGPPPALAPAPLRHLRRKRPPRVSRLRSSGNRPTTRRKRGRRGRSRSRASVGAGGRPLRVPSTRTWLAPLPRRTGWPRRPLRRTRRLRLRPPSVNLRPPARRRSVGSAPLIISPGISLA